MCAGKMSYCVYLGLLQDGLSLRLLSRNHSTCLGIPTCLELHKCVQETRYFQNKLNTPPSGQCVALQFEPSKYRQVEVQKKSESLHGKHNMQVIPYRAGKLFKCSLRKIS